MDGVGERADGGRGAENAPYSAAGTDAGKDVAVSAATGRSGMSAEERRRLLCAIKPALSKRRADAIDSILPLIDIIDLFSGR